MHIEPIVIHEVGGVCPGSASWMHKVRHGCVPMLPCMKLCSYVAGEAEENPAQIVPSQAKTGGGLIKPS